MSFRMSPLVSIASMMLAGCRGEPALPVPEVKDPPFLDINAPPIVLTYPEGPALEALLSGTLTRHGPCLYLDTGARQDLILWLDDVRAGRLDESDWLVTDYTTNQRFREGDFLQGGGGSLPETLDLEAVTPEEIPLECEGSAAIVFHGVEKIAQRSKGAGDLPDPPPPPPSPPTIIDQVKAGQSDDGAPEEIVADVADPREALFLYVAREYQASQFHGDRSICLSDAEGALVSRIAARVSDVHSDTACEWDGPGVVFKATRQPALFVHAHVDCAVRECAAEAGATYGNLGGEGYGYRMRRSEDGWTIQKAGIMWIS